MNGNLLTYGVELMPLRDGRVIAYQDLAGVEFGMTDGNRIVRVHISREALDDIEPTTAHRRDYLGNFDRNRTTIASIASQKYDAGHLAAGEVIHVLASDLTL